MKKVWKVNHVILAQKDLRVIKDQKNRRVLNVDRKTKKRKEKIEQNRIFEKSDKRIITSTYIDSEILFSNLHTSIKGLSDSQVEKNKECYGKNKITGGKKDSVWKRICEAFVNPFTAILFFLAIVSIFTDIVWAAQGEKDPMTVVIITAMILISGMLRFVQETRSGNAAAKLSEMITTTATVERISGGAQEIPLEEVVVGDIVRLSAGDMLPADVRILNAKDLFVSQSVLTGESEAVEKRVALESGSDLEKDLEDVSLVEISNLAFMGSNVISGSATGIVVAVGDNTVLGSISKTISRRVDKTSFEKGVNAVSWVLIRFMLIMVPVVLLINGFTKGSWMQAVLFAISVAVGLTPEMLPMIMTTCLAKGAVAMSKEKTIIKNLNSIQNLGSMDVLCTDKTGTLTQDKVVLEYHLDVQGKENNRVLRHAFLNSYFQTGLKNLMDVAILERTKEEQKKDRELFGLDTDYQKVDEIPFDFNRRRMSVVVADKSGKTQMITKGAVEEMLSICSYAEYGGEVCPLTEQMKSYIIKKVDDLNEDGMRVIAIAQKTNPTLSSEFGVKDEKNMVLMGYLAFLDPPKESTQRAVEALKEYGVAVKILTGDNDKVTRCICKQVGIDASTIILGSDIERMTKIQLKNVVEHVNVFAKLSPDQKAEIIHLLRENGHAVGYMGDGINDAAAMKASDVGISVDTAVDIAKESADVILLEKDLMVLEKGIIEGRKTYANMIKYIKMTASSNFGNMFSVLAASAFLPFLPMESIHLLLLNLIYDISCTAIPWDNVDKEFIRVPRKWDASSVSRFMLWFGPVSSVFDLLTYIMMYFVICPMLCGGVTYRHISDPAIKMLYISLFQAGWFIESMWSQTLVIHMIRTPKLPFIQSRASFPVMVLTFAGIAMLTAIPFTKIGLEIGLTALPCIYFLGLGVILLFYMFGATSIKKAYVRRYGELL